MVLVAMAEIGVKPTEVLSPFSHTPVNHVKGTCSRGDSYIQAEINTTPHPDPNARPVLSSRESRRKAADSKVVKLEGELRLYSVDGS